jgi:hypothetical protein
MIILIEIKLVVRTSKAKAQIASKHDKHITSNLIARTSNLARSEKEGYMIAYGASRAFMLVLLPMLPGKRLLMSGKKS